jgi:hypothetical protein
MNKMVKDLVDFIDTTHPTMVTMSEVEEISPGFYRTIFFYSNSDGAMEVEFRVKQ